MILSEKEVMHMSSKAVCTFMCLILLFAMLFSPSSFAESAAEKEEYSVTIVCRSEGNEIPGLVYSLYRVADMEDDGTLSPVGEFASLPVALNVGEDGRDKLAQTLKAYVFADSVSPSLRGTTGEDGTALVSVPEPGLYLMTAERISIGLLTYSTKPLLLTLPSGNPAGKDPLNRISVFPKFSAEENPEDNPTDETVTRKVIVVWDDENVPELRPERVTIELHRNGEIVDQEELNELNGWRWTWDGLPVRDHLGSVNEWTVVERIGTDHTVMIEERGITFVVVNTLDGETEASSDINVETEEPKLPQTGQLWMPVPYLICGGLLLILTGTLLIRRKAK